MVKISKKVEYALIVLKHFMDADQNEQFTARQICDIYKTPFDTTARVMQIMNNNGVLSSSQGVKGGYTLSIDLSTINYLDLNEIIEQKQFAQDCDQLKCSLIESCNITGPVNKLNQYLYWFLKNLTLKELFQDNGQPLINIKSMQVKL